ncbi:MAG TPA: gephyrin-like molybdotransferase Glp [Bacteroidota bacterium]|nr:gephyrin-like molybdotransferase Glp [Bacteroidota bacterium]
MISAEEALRIILEAVRAVRGETIGVARAAGRTAAEDITCRTDVPPFDNSSMDGFALRSSDVAAAGPGRPVRLALAGESSAGNPFGAKLPARAAVRVMTGGVIPRGADTVVPLEQAEGAGTGAVLIRAPSRAGSYIRRRGEDIPRGRRVIVRGDLLTPPHIGVLSSLGRTRVSVARRPRTAILATGDELVPPGRIPGPGRIRNSSSYALAGMVEEAGGEPRFIGIARDRKEAIRRKVLRGLAADILLLTGGVSVGARDFVGEVLRDAGVDIRFWKVNIRPGSPLLFGVARRTLVFGLPGNPVSTAVTFLQFVKPALRRMLGQRDVFPFRFAALADESLECGGGKRCYLRGIVRSEAGTLRVRTTGSQSSGVMTSMLAANCLIVLPEGGKALSPGDLVEIELLRDPASGARSGGKRSDA